MKWSGGLLWLSSEKANNITARKLSLLIILLCEESETYTRFSQRSYKDVYSDTASIDNACKWTCIKYIKYIAFHC